VDEVIAQHRQHRRMGDQLRAAVARGFEPAATQTDNPTFLGTVEAHAAWIESHRALFE